MENLPARLHRRQKDPEPFKGPANTQPHRTLGDEQPLAERPLQRRTWARHVWRLNGGAPTRFWSSGSSFEVARYDVGEGYVSRWRWNGDDIIVYEDPDSWHLACNTRLGTYVHVQFLGQEQPAGCRSSIVLLTTGLWTRR